MTSTTSRENAIALAATREVLGQKSARDVLVEDLVRSTPRKGHWMQTATGRAYWPFDPRVEDVYIEDIAYALSRECRFGGHIRADIEHYSVAEHSVLCSYLVPPEHALVALMHDAAEAYVKDIPRPVKVGLQGYEYVERLNWIAIARRFGLPLDLPQCVHDADVAMLFAERTAVMARLRDQALESSWGMGLTTPLYMDPANIEGLSPMSARRLFWDRFHELYRGGEA